MDGQDIQQVAQTKKSNTLVIILGAALAPMLLAVGVLAYLYMGQSGEVRRLQESAKASSQEIEALKKQANESDDQVSDAPEENQPKPGDDESKSIVDAVGAYAHTKVASEDAKLTMQITKKELPFARVSVSTEEGTGYACVLKKSDNIWVVLFCGQGAPLQSELDQWGVPDSILQS